MSVTPSPSQSSPARQSTGRSGMQTFIAIAVTVLLIMTGAQWVDTIREDQEKRDLIEECNDRWGKEWGLNGFYQEGCWNTR